MNSRLALFQIPEKRRSQLSRQLSLKAALLPPLCFADFHSLLFTHPLL
jgi:hypothetical protein